MYSGHNVLTARPGAHSRRCHGLMRRHHGGAGIQAIGAAFGPKAQKKEAVETASRPDLLQANELLGK